MMYSDRQDLRSQSLDLLRFPLACVIVIIHVFTMSNLTVQGVEYSFLDFPILKGMILFAKSFLAGQSVPVYFFIAGYVFFYGINLTWENYVRKMRNRFKSLFIPYVVWNLLATVITCLAYLPVFAKFFPGLHGCSPSFHFPNILNMFWDINHGISECLHSDYPDGMEIYPVDIPMWFVRDLMIVAITTPLLNILFKRLGAAFPVVAGLAWFFLPGMKLGHGGQLIAPYFFFSLGAYFSFSRRDMISDFKRIRTLSFTLYPVLGIFLFAYSYFGACDQALIMNGGFPGNLGYVKNLAILAGLPFAYNLAVLMIERWHIRPSRLLASASFFIYAAHELFMAYIEKLLTFVVKPDNELGAIVVLTATVAICIFGCLGAYFFMRRYTPRILNFFTGGRN